MVVVDKFKKWIEVEPVGDCEAETAVKFLKKVIFRFGYPHSIITDNGSNTSEGATQIFCANNGIRLDLTSVSHPQRAMDKLSELTRKSSMELSRASLRRLKHPQDVGWRNCQPCYGA